MGNVQAGERQLNHLVRKSSFILEVQSTVDSLNARQNQCKVFMNATPALLDAARQQLQELVAELAT